MSDYNSGPNITAQVQLDDLRARAEKAEAALERVTHEREGYYMALQPALDRAAKAETLLAACREELCTTQGKLADAEARIADLERSESLLRIGGSSALRRVAELEETLRQVLIEHDGYHCAGCDDAEDGHSDSAYEHPSHRPEERDCDCGDVGKRLAAKAVLERTTPSVSPDHACDRCHGKFPTEVALALHCFGSCPVDRHDPPLPAPATSDATCKDGRPHGPWRVFETSGPDLKKECERCGFCVSTGSEGPATNDAKSERLALAQKAVDSLKAREGEDIDAWAARLAADSVAIGEQDAHAVLRTQEASSNREEVGEWVLRSSATWGDLWRAMGPLRTTKEAARADLPGPALDKVTSDLDDEDRLRMWLQENVSGIVRIADSDWQALLGMLADARKTDYGHVIDECIGAIEIKLDAPTEDPPDGPKLARFERRAMWFNEGVEACLVALRKLRGRDTAKADGK